jgi:uncharacterized membrane protein
MEQKWSRIKSPIAWSSVAALLLFILKTWNVLPLIGLDEVSFNMLFTLIMGTFVAFGIWNNPTDKENW